MIMHEVSFNKLKDTMLRGLGGAYVSIESADGYPKIFSDLGK